ncbi:uncharacterized protein [Argopecten irradians]|uniref:uncharacterized protein n=1 Tax=Argopecten irradians TaxID=31199 RepID=UPI003711FBBB
MASDQNLQQSDFENFFSSLSDLLNYCEDKKDNPTPGDVEYCQEHLDSALQSLEYINFHLRERNVNQELSENIKILISSFKTISQVWNTSRVVHGTPSEPTAIATCVQLSNTGIGRPSVIIDMEKIHFLFSIGFKKKDIARCFMIDRTTLWRKLKEMNIGLLRFTDISDEDLSNEMCSIYQNHPHCGLSMMQGHLRAKGISVPKRLVQKILREMDPASSVLRWGLMARRRKYSVPGPNSLWHIDGHHALIRWRMVTHGGIDGFSRLIVFLCCSGNNRADNVLNLFIEATDKYGLPSRVRGDHGSENVLVKQFMENSRGNNRGSFIGGRSVHNSRIERLWRDVYYGIVQTYYSLFYYMESISVLDVNNEVDLFCLQFVYLPRINAGLCEFTEAYNHHGLRTERGWTPKRIWVNGMIDIERQNSLAVSDVLNSQSIQTFGIDPDEIYVAGDDANEINIPEIDLQVQSDEQKEHLIAMLREHCDDPLSKCEDFGINIYLLARNIVQDFLLTV